MRKLEVNGEKIALSENQTIRLVYENPLICEDRVPIPASMEITVDPTPTNLAVFGYPNRVNSKLMITERPSKLMFGLISLFDGVAKYTGFDGKINFHLRSVEKGNLGKNICDIDFGRVNIGTGTRYSHYQASQDPIDPIKGWGAKYVDKINSAIQGSLTWVAGPIQIADKNEDRYDYILNAICNVEYTYDKKYFATSSGFPYTNPYPRVSFIFDKIFDGLLVDNPLYDDRFKNVVMPTFFHKDYPTIQSNWQAGYFILDNALKPISSAPVESLYFDIASFMPKYSAKEFVKDVLKMFGMVLFPKSNKFEIKTVDSIITGTTILDWTSKLIGSLKTEVLEKRVLSIEMNDIDEVEGAPVIVTNGIDIFGIPTKLDEPYLVEVTTTGEVFEITKSEIEVTSNRGIKTKYNTFNIELKRGWKSAPSYVVADDSEKFTIDIRTRPLPSKYKQHKSMNRDSGYVDLNIVASMWHIPNNSTDLKLRDYTPTIIHYAGITDGVVAGKEYPYLTSHAYDCRGRKIADFSLEPWGDDGIVNKFYKNYRTWIERDKRRATGDFLLSPTDIANLDLSLKYSINNVNFYIEKVEVDVAHDRILPAKVSLIEA